MLTWGGVGVQLEVLEVEATLSDRLRTYWAPAVGDDASEQVCIASSCTHSCHGKAPLEGWRGSRG